MNRQRRQWLALALCAPTLGLSAAALAQDYPTRPVRLVVPFAPGGAADTTARMLAESLGKRLGQPVVVENKPGAGATVGAALVAAAAPDGYTVLYTTPGPQITNPYLMAKLNYNPDDLIPVTRVAWFPNVLVVTPSLPVRDVRELIGYARKNPGKVNYGSAGIGASSHLSGELFKTAANIDISHVPYKGSGQAIQDLVAGNVQMAIDSLSVYLPYIKSGQVRALGIAMPERSPLLPDVPPVAGQLQGFDSTAVNYLTVPKGTPQPVIDRLSREVAAVLADQDLSARMIAMGLVPRASTPAEMAAEVKAERAKWQKVIQDSGAKPE